MTELDDIAGIGSATLSTLRESGIESVDDLASADPSDIDDVGAARSEKLIRRAAQEQVQSQTAAELLETYQKQSYRSSGVEAIDDVLDGGWEPETVSLVYGQSGTAKTQLLFSTMGSVAAEGSVAYLMTEMQSASIADRLKSLSQSSSDLDNIHIYEAYDVDEQYEAYGSIEQDHNELELIVIDSFTAQFRMAERFDGRENLGERSKEMGKHLRTIGEMSRVYQCPVVMSGQVYVSPDMFSGPESPYGGEKMNHFISYFVRMRDSEGNLKELQLENHPGIPEQSVKIVVDEQGIEKAG